MDREPTSTMPSKKIQIGGLIKMRERMLLLNICFYGSIAVFAAAVLNLFGKFLSYFVVSGLFAVMALICVATYKMMIKEQKQAEDEE